MGSVTRSVLVLHTGAAMNLSDQVSKKFSSREWLLVIALITATEYWLLQTSYMFRNWQEVLNYLSFAGTVASLVLAVIAILYSFSQGESQQQANGKLSQIAEELAGASDGLRRTDQNLHGQLDRGDAMLARLASMEGLLTNSNQKLDGLLSQSIDKQVSLPLKGPPEDAVTDGQVPELDPGRTRLETAIARVDSQSLAYMILVATTPQAKLLGIALNESLHGAVTHMRVYEFLREHFAIPVYAASTDKTITSVFSLTSTAFQVLMILRVGGALDFERGKIVFTDALRAQLWIIATHSRSQQSDSNSEFAQQIVAIQATFAKSSAS